MTVKLMKDQDLAGKRVLIRQDLNVPLEDGRITSAVRIDASIPTIQAALAAGAKVMVMSHLGRPDDPRILLNAKGLANHLAKIVAIA